MLENSHRTLISLGRSCQCAHQLRRYTGHASSNYFDWLGTPFEALLKILRQRFQGCFDLADLKVADDQKSVRHQDTGVIYRHLFKSAVGTGLITEADVALQYEDKNAKLEYLAGKWLQQAHLHETLFVRHDSMSEDQAMELHQALCECSGDKSVSLLVVVPPGKGWLTPHPDIYCESGIPLSDGPDNWTGDDSQWDRLLSRYWKPAVDQNTTVHASSRANRSANAPLILFQVPNTIGLGHINRMACVARAIRRINAQVRLLFVVEGNSHGLLETFSLPYILLPSSQVIHKAKEWKNFSVAEKNAIVAGQSATLQDSIKPDLIVYDCFPNLHFASAAIERNTKTVLCIRNMKDYAAYCVQRRVSVVLETCLSILVPHDVADCTLPRDLLDRSTVVGPIVRSSPVNPTAVQLRLNIPGKRVIVISAGGGGHRESTAFLRLCIDSFIKLQERVPELVAVMVPGPLFTAWDQLPVLSNMCVLPFDSHFLETCATADVIISQAGYNSAHELAYLGTPTIMVPALRGYDDQFSRAKDMVARWRHMYMLQEATTDSITALLEEILSKPAPRVRSNQSDGAYGAATHLLNLVEAV